MRFIRLRLANYRGVTTTEVKFAPTGITLVQGPNEAGKTSLGEAIGLLFDFPDSSKHRAVEAIRPVHRDEGPEIELQAESRPYAFTYFKRFHKKPETKLTITRPKPENYTGREAHERAEAILRETLDIDLWKALTIQQGDAIQQPVLANQTSLSAALDKVAGGRPADPQEEGLFDRVREEYSRYYTERGAERKELAESRKAQTEAQAEVARIEQAIQDLEQDIDRAAALQRELGQLKRKEEELAQEVASHTASLEEIGTLESALSATRLKLEAARRSEEMARRDKETREGLIAAVAKAAKEHQDIEESGAMSLSALSQADEKLKKAQTASNEADRRRKDADALTALRRADFDYYNNKLHLDQLRERKERIDQARKNAEHAEDVLAQNKVDNRALKAIQAAERAFLTANAQLETGAPSVLLRGLADCRLSVDDAEIRLGIGEVRTISVADRSKLTIPGMLDVEITAGSSTERLSRKVEEARRLLDKACTAAGVADPDEARKAFEERREALRHLETKGQVEKENLRDLTYEQIERKVHGLQRGVPDYIAKRVPEPAISPDLDSAKKEWAKAESVQREANSAWEAAREALDAARSIREGLNTKHQEARVQLDLLAKELTHARENLEKARKGVPDDALELTLAEAVRLVTAEEATVVSAEGSLKAKNPERVKALAETAKGSLQTTQTRRTAAQTELTEVQTRLKIHGEEGLHEKLHMAQSHLERVSHENQSLFRRAAVAKVLFECMRDERDKARRAYVAPLKEKIEGLGRLVFDDTFQVDINENLQIASRTSNGVTVPFDSLSGGTKEQLSLIFRLACSMIVAKDGGTPVVLDDALGYTDPERLRLMGAVLSKAAKECQIVIFTCIPDRYGNVGEATVVSLA
jgi:DNA repair exonuclease SbcCD ATPase subunit